jgi:hypothetical protein
MALEELRRLSLMTREEDKEVEPEQLEKFLDRLPDELIEKCI